MRSVQVKTEVITQEERFLGVSLGDEGEVVSYYRPSSGSMYPEVRKGSRRIFGHLITILDDEEAGIS